MRRKRRKYVGQLLGIGCLSIVSYIKDLLMGLTLHPSKIEELLAELHDGVCGSHVGGRSLAHWAMTQGFWWSQMQKDANKYA